MIRHDSFSASSRIELEDSKPSGLKLAVGWINLPASCLVLSACLFCAANSAFSQSSTGDASSKEAMPIRLVSGEFDPLAAPSASLPSLLPSLPSSTTSAVSSAASTTSAADSPAQKTTAADSAKAKAALSERQVRLVQFETLPTAEDLAALQTQGIEIVRYVPENSFIVMAPPAKVRMGLLAAGKSAAKTRIRWSGAFPSGSKLHPSVKAALQAQAAASQTTAQAAATSAAAANRLRRFDVMALNTGNLAALTDEIKNQQGAVIRQSGALSSRRVTMDYPLESIANLEALNCVAWIDFWHEPHKRGEREAQICAANLNANQNCSTGGGGGYQTWLDSVGLSGEGMVVNIMDDGLSKGIATNAAGTAHVDIVGRIAELTMRRAIPWATAGQGMGI